MSDQERRRFYRIDDTVTLKTEQIPSAQVEDKLKDFWENQHEFSLRNEFNHQLDEHAADLLAIEKKHPAIARYIKVLQNQVDLLSEKILPDDSHSSSRKEVNISAQGITFISTESIVEGEVVELNLKLLPHNQQIVVFAKIITCDEIDDNQFKLTLDFEHIHEADREILIKHIHGKQLKSIGASRFKDDA